MVAKVATTPEQAKVWISTLRANGVPAHADGELLVDDYAASRRLMNLMGVRVMVPANCVEQARKLLEPVEIAAEELTRQAMAAVNERFDGQVAPPAAATGQQRRWQFWLLLSSTPLLLTIAYKLFAWLSSAF